MRGIWAEGGGGDHFNLEYQIDGGIQTAIDSSELTPVLFDVSTNKEILGETLTIANTLLSAALLNTGLLEGTFSAAAILNFQTDLALAQVIHDDIASTGRQIYAANLELIKN